MAMRVFVKVEIPVVAGNAAIKDGTLPKIIQAFLEKTKPEISFFGVERGHRTMFAVFDLADLSDIPVIAEPLFMGLGANIDIQPVMELADLQKGLAKV
jgi:hypothetical protein